MLLAGRGHLDVMLTAQGIFAELLDELFELRQARRLGFGGRFKNHCWGRLQRRIDMIGMLKLPKVG